jgi:hypothetical protein
VDGACDAVSDDAIAKATGHDDDSCRRWNVNYWNCSRRRAATPKLLNSACTKIRRWRGYDQAMKDLPLMAIIVEEAEEERADALPGRAITRRMPAIYEPANR